jgi:hypothetical protein
VEMPSGIVENADGGNNCRRRRQHRPEAQGDRRQIACSDSARKTRRPIESWERMVVPVSAGGHIRAASWGRPGLRTLRGSAGTALSRVCLLRHQDGNAAQDDGRLIGSRVGPPWQRREEFCSSQRTGQPLPFDADCALLLLVLRLQPRPPGPASILTTSTPAIETLNHTPAAPAS